MLGLIWGDANSMTFGAFAEPNFSPLKNNW
jgi:hypothetical protein